MKDALFAAAVELGQLHTDKWAEAAKDPDPDGMKHYFKWAAVHEPKTFLTIIARMMPLHVTTSSSLTGETPVAMADGGWKLLRDVRSGDMVMSWKDGDLVARMVTAFIPQGEDDIFEVRTHGSLVRGNPELTS